MKNTTTTMPLKKLHPHPLQADYYSDCSAAEDKDLSEDLLTNGQRDPVVVLPAGNAAGLPPYTIIDGHRRAKLLRSIGEKNAAVIVRHDLGNADAATVNIAFLKYNFQRRNMDRLEMARVAKGLYETELGYGSRQFGQREKKQFQDRIGGAMGMSGKSLQRYISLLTTPVPIQNAVRQGLIKLVVGVTISTLPRQQQQELADRIGKLTDKKEIRHIVREYVTTRESGRHARPGMALGSLIRSLKVSLVDLEDRVDDVSAIAAARYLDLLRRSQKMIESLIDRGEHAPPPSEFEKGLSAFVVGQEARRRSA